MGAPTQLRLTLARNPTAVIAAKEQGSLSEVAAVEVSLAATESTFALQSTCNRFPARRTSWPNARRSSASPVLRRSCIAKPCAVGAR